MGKIDINKDQKLLTNSVGILVMLFCVKVLLNLGCLIP
jgi:hypothetical protein